MQIQSVFHFVSFQSCLMSPIGSLPWCHRHFSSLAAGTVLVWMQSAHLNGPVGLTGGAHTKQYFCFPGLGFEVTGRIDCLSRDRSRVAPEPSSALPGRRRVLWLSFRPLVFTKEMSLELPSPRSGPHRCFQP